MLYYRALGNAAAIANTIGRQNEAATLRLLASQVKSEIKAPLLLALYNVSNIDQATDARSQLN